MSWGQYSCFQPKWICDGCGVLTDQNPCRTVFGHEKYIGTLHNGNTEVRERNVYCGAVKPALEEFFS